MVSVQIGMQLRSYQLSDCEAIREAFGRGAAAPLYVLPTGGGKTVVLCYVARSAVDLGKRVLVLVHRRELLEQAVSALAKQGIEAGVIAPGFVRSEHPVQVASVQTMARRLLTYSTSAFDLVIIDEAHHAVAGQWSKVVGHFSKAKRLGVTATPARLDGRGLASQFDRMILGPSPRELERSGFLARSKVFAPPIGFSTEQVRTRMGDYDLADSEKQVITVRALGDTVGHYRRHLNGGTAIAFCCTVKHAELVAETFTAEGIAAESIDGSMSWEQREDKLRRLERGELKVLTSCMLIGEGVDVPSVNGCIMLRPTKSLSLFLQMVGRCLRPAPGKEHAIILDHVGNYERHGHHMDRREWSLEEGVRKRKAEAKGPSLWVCPECYCNVESRRVECSECGHVKPRQEREVIQVAGELIQLSSSSELEDRAMAWAAGRPEAGDPVLCAEQRGWWLVGDEILVTEQGCRILSRVRCTPTELSLLIAMERKPELSTVPYEWLRRDPEAYVQLLEQEQVDLVDRADREAEQRAYQAEAEQRRQQRREQAKAQTFDELVALGRRRGMKHPTGWAMKIIKARQSRAHA